MQDKNIKSLLDYFIDVAKDVSRKRTGQPDKIFELAKTDIYPERIYDLAESFGMMIVKIEARDFLLVKTINELEKINQDLQREIQEHKIAEEIIGTYIDFYNKINIGLCIYKMESIGDRKVFRSFRNNPAIKNANIADLKVETGNTIEENLPGLRKIRIQGICEKILESSQPVHLDNMSFINKDQKKIWYSISIFPLTNNYIGISFNDITDITEKRKTEKLLKERLEYKNKELTSKVMHMAERKERLLSAIQNLHDHDLATLDEYKKLVKTTINNLVQKFGSTSEWDEFESYFLDVHNEFFQKLYEKHPNLTPRETRMCAFIKLKMNTKEIANLTNLTVKTIEVYRVRLRKKLDIAKGVNLVSYVGNL
ncbi:MAG: hypothetical protein KAU06_01415 [Candidatus Marinimicrobia bacterium]|nr:hypothetical protein [Candidatus Neomarinimicrobiota bacterium]